MGFSNRRKFHVSPPPPQINISKLTSGWLWQITHVFLYLQETPLYPLPPASTQTWVTLRDKGVRLSSTFPMLPHFSELSRAPHRQTEIQREGLFGNISSWHFHIQHVLYLKFKNFSAVPLPVESCQAWMALLLNTELQIHNRHMGCAVAPTQFPQINMQLKLVHCFPADTRLLEPIHISSSVHQIHHIQTAEQSHRSKEYKYILHYFRWSANAILDSSQNVKPHRVWIPTRPVLSFPSLLIR